jgi:hypothetical protein
VEGSALGPLILGLALSIQPLITYADEDPPPTFIALHTPDNKRVSVNAAEISSVRDPREGHYGPHVKCVVVMANRSFLGVAEPCDTVHRIIGVQTGHEPCMLVCGGERR